MDGAPPRTPVTRDEGGRLTEVLAEASELTIRSLFLSCAVLEGVAENMLERHIALRELAEAEYEKVTEKLKVSKGYFIGASEEYEKSVRDLCSSGADAALSSLNDVMSRDDMQDLQVSVNGLETQLPLVLECASRKRSFHLVSGNPSAKISEGSYTPAVSSCRFSRHSYFSDLRKIKMTPKLACAASIFRKTLDRKSVKTGPRALWTVPAINTPFNQIRCSINYDHGASDHGASDHGGSERGGSERGGSNAQADSETEEEDADVSENGGDMETEDQQEEANSDVVEMGRVDSSEMRPVNGDRDVDGDGCSPETGFLARFGRDSFEDNSSAQTSDVKESVRQSSRENVRDSEDYLSDNDEVMKTVDDESISISRDPSPSPTSSGDGDGDAGKTRFIEIGRESIDTPNVFVSDHSNDDFGSGTEQEIPDELSLTTPVHSPDFSDARQSPVCESVNDDSINYLIQGGIGSEEYRRSALPNTHTHRDTETQTQTQTHTDTHTSHTSLDETGPSETNPSDSPRSSLTVELSSEPCAKNSNKFSPGNEMPKAATPFLQPQSLMGRFHNLRNKFTSNKNVLDENSQATTTNRDLVRKQKIPDDAGQSQPSIPNDGEKKGQVGQTEVDKSQIDARTDGTSTSDSEAFMMTTPISYIQGTKQKSSVHPSKEQEKRSQVLGPCNLTCQQDPRNCENIEIANSRTPIQSAAGLGLGLGLGHQKQTTTITEQARPRSEKNENPKNQISSYHRFLKKIPKGVLKSTSSKDGLFLREPEDHAWAKGGAWVGMVKQQKDVDPFSIFGCGIRLVTFDAVFQTPDFRRAVSSKRTVNKSSIMRRWNDDKTACGFPSAMTAHQVHSMLKLLDKTRDLSDLAYEPTWHPCDSQCNHAPHQPWCKIEHNTA